MELLIRENSMTKLINENKFDNNKPTKIRFWIKNRYKVIFILSLIGVIYQTSTLSLMFANDVITQNDVRLWNGFFPWWTIFFTFTFWSNFFVLTTYFIYLCFFYKTRLKNNNTFLFITCVYITLVLIIVAFILFPASIIESDNVNFKRHTSSLTLSALIMPHAPGPLLFIFFSMVVFSLNRQGNKIILNYGWWKITLFSLIFFISYMIMVLILNYVPVGAYYIDNGKHIYFDGYTVYSKFTAINPKIVLVSDDEVTGNGSYLNLLYYLLVICVLLIIETIYYWIVKMCFFIIPFKSLKIKQISLVKDY